MLFSDQLGSVTEAQQKVTDTQEVERDVLKQAVQCLVKLGEDSVVSVPAAQKSVGSTENDSGR